MYLFDRIIWIAMHNRVAGLADANNYHYYYVITTIQNTCVSYSLVEF